MFKDYEHISFNGLTNKYRYKIVDTDFEEIYEGTVFADTVIDCYTKRNLPVASNMIRFMLLVRDKYRWSLNDQVEWNKQHNPRWHEVEHDMQMYLTFS